MNISGGGHQLVKLETLGEISHEETVFYIEKNGVGANKKEIEKLHRVLNHKGVRNMKFAFRKAGRLDSQTGVQQGFEMIEIEIVLSICIYMT